MACTSVLTDVNEPQVEVATAEEAFLNSPAIYTGQNLHLGGCAYFVANQVQRARLIARSGDQSAPTDSAGCSCDETLLVPLLMTATTKTSASSHVKMRSICSAVQMRLVCTFWVDDEALAGGNTNSQVRDLISVSVAKAGIEGVPVSREQSPDVLQAPNLELMRAS